MKEENEVPYWENRYIYGNEEFPNKKVEKFYRRFKTSFFAGQYLDLKGNTNYSFYLLCDIIKLCGDGVKGIFLPRLSQNYPETKKYCDMELKKIELFSKTYNGRLYYSYSGEIYIIKEDFQDKEKILHWLTETGEFSSIGDSVFVDESGINLIIDESIRLYGTEKRGCKVLPVGDRLPDFIRFGIVEGNFYFNNSGWNSIKNIENNYEGGEILPHIITTLDGCPEVVKGDFKCAGLGLTTLVGGPKEVDGNYIAKNNSLVTLEGMALKIGGDFDISNNELTDSAWEYAQLNIPSEVGGSCKIRGNRFIKYIGNKI